MPSRQRAGMTLLGLAGLLLAACSSPGHPAASAHTGHNTSGSTSTTAAPPYPSGTTLPLAHTTGSLRMFANVPVPITGGEVSAAESPDGAVFIAPTTLAGGGGATSTVIYVIDGDGPAAVAEHFAGPVTALAADSTNMYVANYSDVTAYNRNTGNEDGQWTLPPINAANASNSDLTALSASDGDVQIAITQGNDVSVYRIVPSSTAAPALLVQGLSAAFGPDGSVVFERSDHHLVALAADGATTVGPVLADAPNGLGGGVQYVSFVAGGYVWVSEPAGQGLDAQLTTYDLTTLAMVATFDGTANEQIVGTTGGTLALNAPYSATVCPDASPTAECIVRLSSLGALSDGTLAGATLQLLGPDPAVVAAAPSNTSLILERLS